MSENLSVTHEPTSTSVKENLEASKSHALQAAEELRAAASAKAQQLKQAAEARAHQIREAAGGKAGQFRNVAEEKVEKVRQAAGTGWEDAKVRAQDLHVETERYVRENPTKAVLTALGIGFVIGLIFRR